MNGNRKARSTRVLTIFKWYILYLKTLFGMHTLHWNQITKNKKTKKQNPIGYWKPVRLKCKLVGVTVNIDNHYKINMILCNISLKIFSHFLNFNIICPTCSCVGGCRTDFLVILTYIGFSLCFIGLLCKRV